MQGIRMVAQADAPACDFLHREFVFPEFALPVTNGVAECVEEFDDFATVRPASAPRYANELRRNDIALRII